MLVDGLNSIVRLRDLKVKLSLSADDASNEEILVTFKQLFFIESEKRRKNSFFYPETKFEVRNVIFLTIITF